jgi:hypothetical protein
MSRNGGLGRGNGGASIGAVSIGPIAGVTAAAVEIASALSAEASGFNAFCSTACADAVSAINPMAASPGARIKAEALVAECD